MNIFSPKLQTSFQDAEGRTVYRYLINNDEVNRNGWVTITAGIDYAPFMLNPVVCFVHDDETYPVGIVTNLFVKQNGMFADIWFHEAEIVSQTVKKLTDMKVLRATSISIIPKTRGTSIPITPEMEDQFPEWMDSIPVFETSELLEVSIVTVPANSNMLLQEKLAAAYKEKKLTKDQYDWINTNLSIKKNQPTSDIPERSTKQTDINAVQEPSEAAIDKNANQKLSNNQGETMSKTLEEYAAENAALLTKINKLEKIVAAAKTGTQQVCASCGADLKCASCGEPAMMPKDVPPPKAYLEKEQQLTAKVSEYEAKLASLADENKNLKYETSLQSEVAWVLDQMAKGKLTRAQAYGTAAEGETPQFAKVLVGMKTSSQEGYDYTKNEVESRVKEAERMQQLKAGFNFPDVEASNSSKSFVEGAKTYGQKGARN